jgi:predicted RNA-binding Zn ribbon-like protein
MMMKTSHPKKAPSAVRARSRANNETLIPREPIAHLIGGHPALDFCNTAGEHLSERPDEMLRDWETFLRWTTQVGLIGPESYIKLLQHPGPLGPVVELREAIYRAGLAIATSRRVAEGDLALIREHANALRPEVHFDNNVVRWQPAMSRASEQLCAVLAGDALSLLCSPKAIRIGICEGGLCGWLFLDESRGKRRRWCEMSDCGSRAKAQRHYERRKGS